jgi:HD-like signal output (HDOD) protein
MDYRAIDYKNIPVQAEIISGIIRLDVESTNCFRDLDSYVRSDQGVATLVLRVVNSPLYSRGNQIATIPRAISVLGFNVVRSLAMLAFSRSMFSKTKDKLFRLHIWQHSLLSAIAGRDICQAIGADKAKDEAFIAGLMHDMGKVLLFTHDEKRYLEVLAQVLEQGCPSVEAEQQVFGCDHCEVGREAVTQWKLPERFVEFMGDALALNQSGLAADPVRLSLTAAHFLVERAGIGSAPGNDSESGKQRLMALGFSETLCDQWLQEDFVPGLMNDETYQLCANL